MIAHRGREDARRERGDDAVEIGGSGAEADQREHVEMPGAERLNATGEEGPAAPQDDRRRERQKQPLLGAWRNERQEIDAEQVPAHLDDGDEERQGSANPEPPGEIDQLFIGRIDRHAHGLQRHAANGARARPLLHDFRVHGAGVERPRRRRLGLRLAAQILLRVGGKLLAAAISAEVIRLSLIVFLGLACVKIHSHAANGIDGGVSPRVCVVCHAFKFVMESHSYTHS